MLRKFENIIYKWDYYKYLMIYIIRFLYLKCYVYLFLLKSGNGKDIKNNWIKNKYRKLKNYLLVR